MTSIDLAEIAGSHIADDGVRRDRWGRYMVVPPEGGAPEPYRRVTTVAKALDSEGALVPWSASRALRGIIADPELLKRLRRMLKAGNDPWYGDPLDKAEFKALIADAMIEGGADERADRGTWLHGCAERHLLGLGQRPTFNAVDQEWLDRFTDCLHDHGVWVDPDWIERIVVHDRYRIAGKADYLQTWVVGFDKPMIGDLKTGETLDYALQGYVIQEAVYAAADAVYEQGDAADGTLDRRLPMPEVDQQHAVLIHAPQSGPEPFAVYLLDVQAGLRAFELARAVEEWRDTPGLVERIEPDLVRVLAESIVVVEDGKRRGWLQERIDAIGQHSPEARYWLAHTWPEHLPSLRQSTEHTAAQLLEIERLCAEAERVHDVPFSPAQPATKFDAIEALMAQFPGSTLEDSE